MGDTNVAYHQSGRWTKPWTVQIPLARTQDRISEYACHEGDSLTAG